MTDVTVLDNPREIGCGHCGKKIYVYIQERLMDFTCPHCGTWFEDECDCPDWGY
jgi:predicted RNA-binding Zn-ribbon protein involved in translation (DUF1610 family)